MLDLKNISREFTAQFILCVLIALSAPQGKFWPLFVFLVWVPFRNAFPDTTVHTTSTLAKVFLNEGGFSCGGCSVGQILVDILVQFIGAILGGWVAFLILEDNSSAPKLAKGADEGRAFIIIAVVVGFWAILNTNLKGEGFDRNASAAFLWIGTVFALQELVPGAVGNISTDIGRIIAAKIKGDGSNSLEAFNFDGAWIFVIAPLVGIVCAKLYLVLEGCLDKLNCCDGEKNVSGGNPHQVPQQESSMPMAGGMASPQMPSQRGSNVQMPSLGYSNGKLQFGGRPHQGQGFQQQPRF